MPNTKQLSLDVCRKDEENAKLLTALMGYTDIRSYGIRVEA